MDAITVAALLVIAWAGLLLAATLAPALADNDTDELVSRARRVPRGE